MSYCLYNLNYTIWHMKEERGRKTAIAISNSVLPLTANASPPLHLQWRLRKVMQNPCRQSKILLPSPPWCYHKMSAHSSISAFHIYIKTIYSECTCHLCHVAHLKLKNLITMRLLKAISTAKESVSTYNPKICKNTITTCHVSITVPYTLGKPILEVLRYVVFEYIETCAK